ncbi:hypothetical protein J4E93_005754 [Alternaria ventricosa]|uniref:uncharacterized protein n=1 Tax=Alternaria ventricosa TaxID=1187951 RepID=UPI0020C4F0F7|nr:uncharacterized protein J4E93_005754 [Alternaria ventricosa]KAI4644955.1 hypothetical protein J4E93_005754 [Alternaria ventricosa]
MPYTNYFDNPYLGGPGPDDSLNTFFDSDTFFDQNLTSVQSVSGTTSKTEEDCNATFFRASISTRDNNQTMTQTFNTIHPSPFEPYPFDFTLDTRSAQPNEPNCFSPTSTTSQSSSHGGDAPQPLISPSLSPHMLKHESPSSPTSASESSTPKRPTRKRGRPKMDRSTTDSQVMSSPTLKYQRSKRLPHNQVERKYREGLNSELERLRQSVPILRQSDEVGAVGQPKPSKAMILASAIEYIQSIEKERDALIEENDRLRRERFGGPTQDDWDGMNL